MSYYDIPEQRLEPQDMSQDNEEALERAAELLSKIYKLHDKAESFFDELILTQLENIFADAEYSLEELESLYNDYEIIEDDYNTAKWMVDDIEGWFHEKEESIKLEDK